MSPCVVLPRSVTLHTPPLQDFFFIDVELCADLRVQVEVEHISTVGKLIGYAK